MANVLIVDDDADIRTILHMALEEEGYTIAEANNGRVALELLRTAPERWVVLTDSYMPEMDGETMLRHIATDQAVAPRHAYIFMTARALTTPPPFNDVIEALHASIVTKPFEIVTILDAVADSAKRL